MSFGQRGAILLFLGLLGVLLSYFKFFEWFAIHGFDIVGGWKEGFSASLFGTGFILDLVACTLMVFALALMDWRQLGVSWVVGILFSTLVFSVSIGLALYLLRMHGLESQR